MSVAAVGAGIGAAATIYSVSQSGKAGDAQIEAGARSDAITQRQQDQTRSDYAPFLKSGVAANDKLATLVGLNTNRTKAFSDPAAEAEVQRLMNDPTNRISTNLDEVRQQVASGWAQPLTYEDNSGDAGFGSLTRDFSQDDLNNDVVYNNGLQFGLDQGNQGLNRLAAASGSLNSGAQLKALTRFGNDYGTTKTQGAYDRFNNNQTTKYNRLAGISGAGQQAVGAVTGAGVNNSNNQSQNALALGNSRAASAIGSANGLTSGLGSISNYYQQNQIVNKLEALKNSGNSMYGSRGGFTTSDFPNPSGM